MKKKNTAHTKSIIEKASSDDNINTRLNAIENLIKVIDKKNDASFAKLKFEVTGEVLVVRKRLEKSFQSQTLVLLDEIDAKLELFWEKLKGSLGETEKRLNNRITHVGDLITIDTGNRIASHEKRIKKLEKVSQVA